MALNPLQDDLQRAVEVEPEIQPSKTYAIDFNNGILGEIIEGEDALRQFIRKTLKTSRFRFLIYDNDYGSELDDLISADVSDELLKTEIPRVVRESLIYDERISDVKDFSITRNKGDLYVEFTVVTVDGLAINEAVIF